MNKVIVDCYGEKKSIDLNKCRALGVNIREYSPGINIDEVYITPSGRVIVEQYSIWQKKNGQVTGTTYSIADDSFIAALADASQNDYLLSIV